MKPGRILDIRLIGVEGRRSKEPLNTFAVTVEVGKGMNVHVQGFYVEAKDELDAYRNTMHKARREGIELTMLGDEDENQDK